MAKVGVKFAVRELNRPLTYLTTEMTPCFERFFCACVDVCGQTDHDMTVRR